MKKIALCTALGLMSISLAACGGHYDKDGNYVSYDTNGRTVIDTEGNRTFVPDSPPRPTVVHVAPASEVNQSVTETYDPADGDVTTTRTTTVTSYNFVKPGYYDAKGFYIQPGYGPAMPTAMMPPPGLCRIWYQDRAPESEPGIQSCDGIRSRVPMGAYVIYGG